MLLRTLPKDERQKTAEALIADDKALQLFLKISSGNFEETCRKYLNQMNSSLGLQSKVFSFPIVACTVEGHCVFKSDLENSWVDFNMGKEERGLAFYRLEEEGAAEQWQLEAISEEEVLEVNISSSTPKCMLVSISRSGPGVVELSIERSYLDQVLQILRQLFGSKLKETNMSMSEAAPSSTPKKTLLLSKKGPQHSEIEELPVNTSIPPSEEEEGCQESFPCAQAAQEQVEKEGRPSKQTNTSTCRQPREVKESKAKSKVKVSSASNAAKVRGGAKSYSPVVTIGKARVDVAAKKRENIGSDMDVGRNKATLLEHVTLSSTSAPVEESEGQIEATPEMVGEPGVRKDVAMTRSGGRKRALRKVSESQRQKMQEKAKQTHLDFKGEVAAVSKDEAKPGSSRGLVVNNKQPNTCGEASTSRGRKEKAVDGLKKMLGKVPRAFGFCKNTSSRVSVSPTLGDISEVSARGFQKRRASSALGAGGEKRRKPVLKSNVKKIGNQNREDPEENSNSPRISRTVSYGRVELGSSVCEANTLDWEGTSVTNPKKAKGSHQEMRVDGQDEIQGDFEEEMVVEVNLQEKVGFNSGSKSKSSGPSQGGGNKEQEKAEGRRHQGMRGSATRSGDGNSLQGVGCHLQQVYYLPENEKNIGCRGFPC